MKQNLVLINAVTNDAKYTKYIKMQLIVLKCQTAKFGKSADILIVTNI